MFLQRAVEPAQRRGRGDGVAAWRRLVAVVGLVGLIVCVSPGWALAHAVLLRSTPSSNQSLARAPGEVRLLFSEPVDIVFSGIRVFDAAGQVVDGGDAHVDPEDDHQLVVSLKPSLPNGMYTVTWRSLSTIDVHPDQGQYRLFVGVPVAAADARDSGTVPVTATPETTLGRWWFYLAVSLFGGVLAAWKLVLSGVLAGGQADVRAAVHRRTRLVMLAGGGLLIVGTLFTAVAQAAAAADVSLVEAVGQPLADLLLRGRFAAIWWPRIGLEVASLLLIVFGDLDGLAADCALATLPAVLLTSSLTSHGAALPLAGVGIAIDWLHIVGATAWVGGLVSVLIVLPVVWRSDRTVEDAMRRSDRTAEDAIRRSDRTAEDATRRSHRTAEDAIRRSDTTAEDAILPHLVARFSRFALTASALVVVSGVVQAVFEIGSWAELVESSYGKIVLVKVVLFADMVLLASFNTWRGRRRYPSGAQERHQVGLFRRGVRAELALGIVVLAVAAVLTGTPPNRLPTPGYLNAPPTAAR